MSGVNKRKQRAEARAVQRRFERFKATEKAARERAGRALSERERQALWREV